LVSIDNPPSARDRQTFFFFNDTANTEIYTSSIVGSVRCVKEKGQTLRVVQKLARRFFKVQHGVNRSTHRNRLSGGEDKPA
ncbi:hypothetical protein, partial [Brenneria goodwinii]|uniref:hypothetical protein n=1 Tax=Brenneria goodwinii TaxID=1109412 RepID=UPI0016009C07